MAENTRTLGFIHKGLDKNITLLLIFTPPAPGQPYKDVFPTCWKVIKLKKSDLTTVSVQYTSDTAFAVPQIDADNLVTASALALCGTGQKCSILDDGVITAPVPGDAGYLLCTNDTTDTTDIAVGFSEASGFYFEPICVWEKVPMKSKVKAQFTPILEIYATSDYQDTQILRNAVESPLLWKNNLQTLHKCTALNVSIDGTGGILITEA